VGVWCELITGITSFHSSKNGPVPSHFSLNIHLDMWAVGCIFAELLTLKPLFQGAEVKATSNPFQVLDAISYSFLIL